MPHTCWHQVLSCGGSKTMPHDIQCTCFWIQLHDSTQSACRISSLSEFPVDFSHPPFLIIPSLLSGMLDFSIVPHQQLHLKHPCNIPLHPNPISFLICSLVCKFHDKSFYYMHPPQLGKAPSAMQPFLHRFIHSTHYEPLYYCFACWASNCPCCCMASD